MAYENNEKDKTPATGITGTVLGGTALAVATGLLNGGLGGILGGNQNPTASPVYQLSAKDNEIALLKAQQYSDNKVFALSEKVANLEGRVLTIEKTEPLRDQIIGERVANLQAILNGIARPMVPNYALAPGYGPAFVGPMPPPGYAVQPIVNSGTTTTPASTTTAQAA